MSSWGINFNVCFVFYVDGGNLAKYFPLSPQLDFPSGSLHSIFKYCSLRQIVFCQLDPANSQTHGPSENTGLTRLLQQRCLREGVKYYFADFVRKGGGTPQLRNPLFAEKKSVKGGRGVPPKSVTYFLDQNQVFFWAKNTIFSPFWRKFFGEKSVKGGRGYPPNP